MGDKTDGARKRQVGGRSLLFLDIQRWVESSHGGFVAYLKKYHEIENVRGADMRVRTCCIGRRFRK